MFTGPRGGPPLQPNAQFCTFRMPKASKGELSRCENRPPSAGKWPHPQNEGKLAKLRGCADGPPSAAEWPLLLFSLTEKVQKSAFRRGGMRDYKSERFVETGGPFHGFSDFLHIWKEPHGRPFRRDETLTFGFRKAFKNSKSKHSVSTDRSFLKT